MTADNWSTGVAANLPGRQSVESEATGGCASSFPVRGQGTIQIIAFEKLCQWACALGPGAVDRKKRRNATAGASASGRGCTSLSKGQAKSLSQRGASDEISLPKVTEIIREMTVEWKGRTYDVRTCGACSSFIPNGSLSRYYPGTVIISQMCHAQQAAEKQRFEMSCG